MKQPHIYDLVISQMADSLFVMSVDESGQFRYAKMNPSAMAASGLNQSAYGATFEDVVIAEEAQFLQTQYTKVYRLERPSSFVLNHAGQIGETVLSPIISPGGLCTHIVGVVRDITKHYDREQYWKNMALRDALTGLPNRHGLESGLQESFQQARSKAEFASIFIIDADGLKQVNDTYGHAIGDLYLRDLAQRLRSSIREKDIVWRLGGDEFLIVAMTASVEDVIAMSNRILQAFQAPWPHEDVLIQMSVSIGVATYPIDADNPWDVIKAADRALYRAKDDGGGRCAFAQELTLSVREDSKPTAHSQIADAPGKRD